MSFYDIPGFVDSWSLKYVICACCILCGRVRVPSVFVEEIEHDRAGQLTTAEITTARGALDVLEGLMADTTTGTDGGGGPFFGGAARSTLADLWAAPMIAYLQLAPTGAQLLAEEGYSGIRAWLEVMAGQPSMQLTRFPRELAAHAAAAAAEVRSRC